MNERLSQLRAELEKGNQELTRLERRRQEIHHTMLRISGAIQVLEELAAKEALPLPGQAAPAVTVAA